MMKKGQWWRIMIGVTLIGAVMLSGCVSTAPGAARPQRVSVKWNTADVGSYGYSVASLMVELLNRELPNKLGGTYVVTIHPYPATGAGMKAAMDGDGDIAYTADVGMTEVYDAVGAYSTQSWPGRAKAELLVHSFYAYPMETFMATHASSASQFNSWGDFSGKPVFFTPAGFMNWLNMQRIFKVLGYEFNHAEIDSGMTADALRDGAISGAASYTTAGRTLPTYWREAEMGLRGDLRIINPTEEEKQKLAAVGLTPILVDPKKPFSQDVGVSEIWGVPILFGYNIKPSTPTEFVHAMLQIFEENADKLVGWEPGFGPLADDFVGMQVAGIRANAHIPVHAGMAQWLKEKGVWEESWIIAQ
jgi:TRAP-type uncharacterized transport system substrate-binding protein